MKRELARGVPSSENVKHHIRVRTVTVEAGILVPIRPGVGAIKFNRYSPNFTPSQGPDGVARGRMAWAICLCPCSAKAGLRRQRVRNTIKHSSRDWRGNAIPELIQPIPRGALQ